MVEKFNNHLIKLYNVKFNISVWENENLVWLNLIYVPKKYRCKGIATEILNDFIKWLDTNGFNSSLLVGDCYGMSEGKLINFYKKFGYEIDYRMNKNLYLFRKSLI